jgi:hypothetical protein
VSATDLSGFSDAVLRELALGAEARLAERAKRELLARYDQLAIETARQAAPLYGTSDRSREREDRDQDAREAMWIAIRSYDPAKGPLAAWIRKHVWTAMMHKTRAELRHARKVDEHDERVAFVAEERARLETDAARAAERRVALSEAMAIITSLPLRSLDREVAEALFSGRPLAPLNAKYGGPRVDGAFRRLQAKVAAAAEHLDRGPAQVIKLHTTKSNHAGASPAKAA